MSPSALQRMLCLGPALLTPLPLPPENAQLLHGLAYAVEPLFESCWKVQRCPAAADAALAAVAKQPCQLLSSWHQ